MNKVNSAALDLAVEAFLNEKFGGRYKIIMRGGRFDEDSLTMRIQFMELIDGKAPEPEARSFAKYCYSYNLEPSDLGKVIAFKRSRYKILGLDMRKRKFPFLAENVETGKQCRFTAKCVQALLGKEPK
jgi:hypothetical protein